MYGGPFGSKIREYKTHVNTRLEDTLRQRAQATHAQKTRSGNVLRQHTLSKRAEATHDAFIRWPIGVTRLHLPTNTASGKSFTARG